MTGFPSQIPPRDSSLRVGQAGGVAYPPDIPCRFILIGRRPRQWSLSNRNSESRTHYQSALYACHYWRQYFRNVFHENAPFASRQSKQGAFVDVGIILRGQGNEFSS